jgi:ribonuclease VapC
VNGKSEYVLDSTALLAVIFLEPGSEQVEAILSESVISSVNVAETINKLVLRGSPVDIARSTVLALQLKVEDWTEEMAYQSAELSPFNKSHGLSLGDRACLILAKRLRATAVTSDRSWRRAPSLGVRVMIFR